MNIKSAARLLLASSLFLSLAGHGADFSEATIKRVDSGGQRLLLAHGPIPSLGMPPMTMMFPVKDAAMLKGLKAGDKIRFQVEEIDGAPVVTRIEDVPVGP